MSGTPRRSERCASVVIPLSFPSATCATFHAMKTRLIPHTTLEASVLCLGTAEFGSAVDHSLSEKLIEKYLDEGGNVLDTAEIYASWLPGCDHRSEEFLGAWLRKRKNRDGIIISTKGAHPRLHSMDKPRMSKSVVEGDRSSPKPGSPRTKSCSAICWANRFRLSRSSVQRK
jgi:aryl-alcohol dehydrogenase-like predicted oxidoreductase